MRRAIVGMLVGAVAMTVAAPGFAAEVDRRQHRQEKRIEQGEKSGKLTPAAEGKLQGEHRAVRKQINQERAANGGHLTRSERRQVNREQNAESKEIYQDKH